MICPNCRQETLPGLFCHACDSYLPQISAGIKAGVARRFAALILDGIAAWVIFFLIVAISAGVGQGNGGSGAGTFILAVIGYTIFAFWFLSQGKTPGKWLVGAVDKRNGGNPGLGRMLVREIIGKFVSGVVLGFGYLWAIFDKDTQAWHDKIAGTVVLRRSSSAEALIISVPLNQMNTSPFAISAEPGAAVQQINQFCIKCGSNIKAGSRFCEKCGAAQ